MNRLIKICFFISLAVLVSAASFSQNPTAPKPYGALPSPRQLKWQETEMYCIIHFTPTTFQNLEWGYGDADPSIFNPSDFNAQQIVDAAKSGGFKGIVYVAKHHDGFALWPTKTSPYNISKSPWKNGKGDVVKEFQMAAKKAGMKFGIYCSPWDRHSSVYGTPEYITVYRNQLKELYTNYGDLFMSWHDGANGGDGFYGGKNEKRKIDQTTYYDWRNTWKITRKLQPNASIFSDIGLDVRWVGNERGEGPETSWPTIDLQGIDGKPAMPGSTQDFNLGTGTRGGKKWIPFEGDVALRPGWFYHPEEDSKVKNTAELFNIYCSSVGHGGALDLGLSPTREGRLHPNDVKALAAFGSFLKETFAHNLAKEATISVSNLRGNLQKEFGPVNLIDGDRYSYWATDDQVHHAYVTLSFKDSVVFSLIQLRENIKLGQRIDSIAVEIFRNNEWVRIAKTTSIGANKIIRLAEPQKAAQVRIQVYAPVCVALSEAGLYLEPKIVTESNVKDANVLDNTGWKVIDENGSTVEGGFSAIDQNKTTVYSAHQNSIVLDFGSELTFSGLGYLPAQDKSYGAIEKYELLISVDAKHWTSVKSGEFANIRSNPIMQRIILDKIISARYVKLTALQVVSDELGKTNLRIAEINVYR
jgi:alpha-L-fucosidase